MNNTIRIPSENHQSDVKGLLSMLIYLDYQIYFQDWSAVLNRKHHDFQHLPQAICTNLVFICSTVYKLQYEGQSSAQFVFQLPTVALTGINLMLLVTVQIMSLSNRLRLHISKLLQKNAFRIVLWKILHFQVSLFQIFQFLPSKSQDFGGGKQLIPQLLCYRSIKCDLCVTLNIYNYLL